MNRLVCLGWISKPERKENFSFETRVAPLRTQPKLQPRFLTLSPMRLSHNGYLELMLTHSETLSAAAKRVHVFARPLHDQIHRELMSAHDEPLSVVMYVLLALLAVVENGYD